MNVKEKVKNYYKEHEDEIKIAAGIIGFGAICALWGGLTGTYIQKKRYFGNLNDDCIKSISGNVKNYMSGVSKTDITGLFLGHVDKGEAGMKPDELGELGKCMLHFGTPETQEFTHIIAIGKWDK